MDKRKLRHRLERTLHWVIAPGLVLVIGIGLYGDALPYAAGRDAAWTVTVYGLHKTAGLAMLYLAVGFALSMRPWRRRAAATGRISWAMPLGRAVFWGLLVGALVIPLTGPILHGMGPGWGYAPIWWPFGDRVPGVPERFATDPNLRALHIASWWLFAGLAITHVALACRRWLIQSQGATARRTIRWRMPAIAYRIAPVIGAGLWVVLAALVWGKN
ncbi:cytochrome b/b6 domain-containing protein [Paracoccus tegillarcae]|uniref:Cytochrome b561 bacterial/Ni-hydrogenase domain-containing protein n=1 Tax=Paracoccus tegillarcae TaxID=1529068 RepID=A0A2K9EGX3_9RHOB|nr:cytochrome b/b6 domain-containing protein [Paracoccus tegillarcae]AUH34203.1 hypothetical protein CUV01_13095 [Paracoccus tegillarcae]